MRFQFRFQISQSGFKFKIRCLCFLSKVNLQSFRTVLLWFYRLFRVWFAAYHEARASDLERRVFRISVTSTVLSISNNSATQNSSKEMLE